MEHYFDSGGRHHLASREAQLQQQLSCPSPLDLSVHGEQSSSSSPRLIISRLSSKDYLCPRSVSTLSGSTGGLSTCGRQCSNSSNSTSSSPPPPHSVEQKRAPLERGHKRLTATSEADQSGNYRLPRRTTTTTVKQAESEKNFETQSKRLKQSSSMASYPAFQCQDSGSSSSHSRDDSISSLDVNNNHHNNNSNSFSQFNGSERLLGSQGAQNSSISSSNQSSPEYLGLSMPYWNFDDPHFNPLSEQYVHFPLPADRPGSLAKEAAEQHFKQQPKLSASPQFPSPPPPPLQSPSKTIYSQLTGSPVNHLSTYEHTTAHQFGQQNTTTAITTRKDALEVAMQEFYKDVNEQQGDQTEQQQRRLHGSSEQCQVYQENQFAAAKPSQMQMQMQMQMQALQRQSHSEDALFPYSNFREHQQFLQQNQLLPISPIQPNQNFHQNFQQNFHHHHHPPRPSFNSFHRQFEAISPPPPPDPFTPNSITLLEQQINKLPQPPVHQQRRSPAQEQAAVPKSVHHQIKYHHQHHQPSPIDAPHPPPPPPTATTYEQHLYQQRQLESQLNRQHLQVQQKIQQEHQQQMLHQQRQQQHFHQNQSPNPSQHHQPNQNPNQNPNQHHQPNQNANQKANQNTNQNPSQPQPKRRGRRPNESRALRQLASSVTATQMADSFVRQASPQLWALVLRHYELRQQAQQTLTNSQLSEKLQIERDLVWLAVPVDHFTDTILLQHPVGRARLLPIKQRAEEEKEAEAASSSNTICHCHLHHQGGSRSRSILQQQLTVASPPLPDVIAAPNSGRRRRQHNSLPRIDHNSPSGQVRLAAQPPPPPRQKRKYVRRQVRENGVQNQNRQPPPPPSLLPRADPRINSFPQQEHSSQPSPPALQEPPPLYFLPPLHYPPRQVSVIKSAPSLSSGRATALEELSRPPLAAAIEDTYMLTKKQKAARDHR